MAQGELRLLSSMSILTAGLASHAIHSGFQTWTVSFRSLMLTARSDVSNHGCNQLHEGRKFLIDLRRLMRGYRYRHGQCSGVRYVDSGLYLPVARITDFVLEKVVATVVAGTVQLGVITWWEWHFPHGPILISLNRMFSHIPYAGSRVLRNSSDEMQFPQGSMWGQSERQVYWLSPHLYHCLCFLFFSFTCNSTQVFGTASIIVNCRIHCRSTYGSLIDNW